VDVAELYADEEGPRRGPFAESLSNEFSRASKAAAGHFFRRDFGLWTPLFVRRSIAEYDEDMADQCFGQPTKLRRCGYRIMTGTAPRRRLPCLLWSRTILLCVFSFVVLCSPFSSSRPEAQRRLVAAVTCTTSKYVFNPSPSPRPERWNQACE
jgi:hypothetical protein